MAGVELVSYSPDCLTAVWRIMEDDMAVQRFSELQKNPHTVVSDNRIEVGTLTRVGYWLRPMSDSSWIRQ